jgi:FKBP-type peptidyl-prolyl cis-trans isomerase
MLSRIITTTEKYTFVAIICGTIFLMSCEPTPDRILTEEEQLEQDIKAIEQYLDDNNINAEVDSILNAVYYVVHDTGSGTMSPSLEDSINVSYLGRFFDSDQPFDQSSGATFPLNRLIQGWQAGLQMVNEGDSVTLFIPSRYAYGRFGAGAIGPNTNVIFDIRLKEITTK